MPRLARPFAQMMVTVFTRPLCAMCSVMIHWLRELRVAHREIDVAAVPEARRLLRALGGGELAVPSLVLEDGRVLVEPSREALLAALRKRVR